MITTFNILLLDEHNDRSNKLLGLLNEKKYAVYLARSVEQAQNIVACFQVDAFICYGESFLMSNADGIEQIVRDNPNILSVILTENEALSVAVAGLENSLQQKKTNQMQTVRLNNRVKDYFESETEDDLDLLEKETPDEKRVQAERELEEQYPGITRIKKDANGFLIL
jgi:DNA-binding NtrC family response regulator